MTLLMAGSFSNVPSAIRGTRGVHTLLLCACMYACTLVCLYACIAYAGGEGFGKWGFQWF